MESVLLDVAGHRRSPATMPGYRPPRAIHRGFCEYRSACEERRQLAIDVGEITAKFIGVLCGAGFSEDDARGANVRELARPAVR